MKVPIITETETELVQRDVEPCLVRVTGVAGGFEVFLRSKLVEDFFIKYATNAAPVQSIYPGILLRTVTPDRLPEVPDIHWGSHQAGIFDNMLLNGAYLRAVGLGEGITVKIEVGPAPPNFAWGKSLGLALKQATKDLYLRYIAPFQWTCVVTSRETLIS